MSFQSDVRQAGPDPKLRLASITHRFEGSGGSILAVDNISLDVYAGQLVSIIGQSGCGKSTLFNIFAGLLKPSDGAVILDGKNITGRAGLVSYMLQKDLLLPWRTILDNVIYGLEVQGRRREEARATARPFMERYGLGSFENHYPAALSGGMRQRAALLRTLLSNKDVILLDEPFAALDAQTRFQMQQWLLTLWQDFNLTILFVTHDVDEAIFLSDKIIVLSPRPGRVRDTFTVDLPRPRGRDVITGPDFGQLKHRCMELLFEGQSTERNEEAQVG